MVCLNFEGMLHRAWEPSSSMYSCRLPPQLPTTYTNPISPSHRFELLIDITHIELLIGTTHIYEHNRIYKQAAIMDTYLSNSLRWLGNWVFVQHILHDILSLGGF